MCEHHEHHHENEKSPLKRVLAAFVIFSAAMLINLDGVLKFVVFLCAYLLAGGDILPAARGCAAEDRCVQTYGRSFRLTRRPS